VAFFFIKVKVFMNSMLIAIPSKKRSQYILKDTLKWLQHTSLKFKIFVESSDFIEYEKLLHSINRGTSHLVVIDEVDKGLSYVLDFIKQWAIEHNYKYVFKLDDDVISIRDPATRGMGHDAPRIDFKYRCHHIFEPLVAEATWLLDQEPNVGAISLMYGQDMKTYSGETWIGINKRLQTNYIIRTELLTAPGMEKFNGTFTDFTTFFNLIHHGYHTVQYGLTGFDVRPVGVHTGGLQQFNRGQAAQLTINFLQANYPWVAFKPVKNKTWTHEPDIRKSLKQYETHYAKVS
jgi:hypothetical protein